MRHRAHIERIEPDPVKAILRFHKQLAIRGIDLIVMPVPNKPGVDALRFSRRVDPSVPLQNPSFLEFKTRLESGGVRIFDPGPLLIQRKESLNESALYLETDTHWRPETMEYLAKHLAKLIRSTHPKNGGDVLQVVDKEIRGVGDTARMLRLPASQEIYRPQEVTIHQVFSGDRAWRPNKESDILLLGDSFSNIYSLDALGWGEAAGFAEHLSHALDGERLDCILRNSDGAFATREMLGRDLARGHDRLAGKKLVIWEFAARELTFGDWKSVDLTLGQARSSQFFVPKAGAELLVTGTVEDISDVPRPGTVPYRDHIASVHLNDLQFADRTAKEALECLVYLQSMHDNVLTAASHLRPGDRIKLRLRPWTDVADQFEKTNRSELDDPVIQLEEPCWGEIIP
jgi:alginate O-acetyltransferase complex protein AlgJ